jgi:hypothetical protein
MNRAYAQENLAIFAYGSLLSDPGEKIAAHIIARITQPSPWPIEYARRAKLRGDGPTLVMHRSGGIVQGNLLVLDVLVDRVDEVEVWLWEREGKPPLGGIKRMELGSLRHVFYCDLEATLGAEDINADALARFAIESVGKQPARNAIKYLANNIAQGVITPLTYAYRDAILRLTGGQTLGQAEQIVARSADRAL